MTGKYLPILPGFPVPSGNTAPYKNTFYRSGKMFHMDLSVALQLNIDPQNKNLLFIELIFMSCTLATPCSSSLTRVRICLTLSMPSAEFLRKLPSVSRSQYYCSEWVQHTCRIFMSSVEVFRVCLVRGLKVKCTVSWGLFAAFPKFKSADYNNIFVTERTTLKNVAGKEEICNCSSFYNATFNG